MRIVSVIFIILSFPLSVHGQTAEISLTEYLKPKSDTLIYNCLYASFHQKDLKETIKLVYRKISVGDETAYYISNTMDSDGSGAQLASFIGSAMIFRNDSILLAPLTWGESPNKLTQKDFDRILSPNLTFSKPFELAKLKWNGLITEVFIKNHQYEDLSIDDTILKKCLRLNLLVYDRSTEPYKATVWLNRKYGIVKWIRSTGREEILDITQF